MDVKCLITNRVDIGIQNTLLGLNNNYNSYNNSLPQYLLDLVCKQLDLISFYFQFVYINIDISLVLKYGK